ncbi:MAG: exodeoxyribonuclease VII large subunit [Planctomycetota bacterium]|nr:exodeoxyribonuclease VII large subunit [Planctomycetota bacterium]
MVARSFARTRWGYNARMTISDDWNLDGESEPALEQGDGLETLTVPQVSERIEGILQRGFPRPFWMVGEAVGWDRTRAAAANKKSGRHWYFELVDDQAKGGRRASLSVKMWQGTVEKLFGRHGRLAARLDPADGLVLKALVKPDFYAPRGQLSFTIEDIDPEHTLGNLDKLRREVLSRLQEEGADEWNKNLLLPDVPLRLGLVTSRGSAAHQDVMETLNTSGLGFEVLFCDARTQGAETTPSVCGALTTLAREAPDVILLVRGGGSRLDLSWFDREEIARAVAQCSVPVLTGIGHEIDTSVADVMAHTPCRTPTAAAEFVVARARQAAEELDRTREQLLLHVSRTLDEHWSWLERSAQGLLRGAHGALRDSDVLLSNSWYELTQRTESVLARAREGVERGRVRLVSGSHIDRINRLDAALQSDNQHLSAMADLSLTRAEAAIESVAQRVRLLDPRSVLARGYAYLKKPDGRILMDVAASKSGEELTAVLRDGELDLRVAATRSLQPPAESS